MKTDIELAKKSLSVAKSGWYRYLATLWLLVLVLIIDLMTEQQFLSDKGNISFFDLEIPRIAFSFTYSALFGVFVVWAAGSAKTTREIVCPLAGENLLKTLLVSPEYRLWGLSPVNRSAINRVAFWLLSGNGLLFLLGISVIHLGKINLPPCGSMSPELYQGIGVFSVTILVLTVYLTLTCIYPAWGSLYRLFSEDEKR